jgi:hypothetical protein
MLPARAEARPVLMAMIGGLACAFAIGKALPVTMDAISTTIAPLCATSANAGAAGESVELITSQALPNVPGKRITVVRVSYGPGGFSRPHRHAGSVTAYITKGQMLATGRRSSRDVPGRAVFLRAAGVDARGLGQWQRDRARRIDRGVRRR